MWRMTQQPQEGMDFPSGSYPVRLGEPDCAYYMRTGVCGFGRSCRFNHPPNRVLPVLAVARGQGEYPERFGQPECQYYLKTGTCKFGAACKFHHPGARAGFEGRAQLNALNLPLRPGERDCAYYMRTCSCKFGVTCRFNHPEPVGTLLSMPGSSLFPGAGLSGSVPAPQPYPTGLPAWPIARGPYVTAPRVQAPSSFAPVFLPSPRSVVSIPGWTTFHGQIASPDRVQQAVGAGFIYGTAPPQDPSLHAPFSPYMSGAVGLRTYPTSSQYPERPGQPECQYYMKSGECKFGDKCRFHHPRDRGFPSTAYALNPMGLLPLRPGAPPCTFYARHGFCKFGSTCKFDHPLSLSTSSSVASVQYSGGSFPIALSSASAEPHRTDPSRDPSSTSG